LSKIAKKYVDEYNNTTHGVTKFSPAYLLFGVRSRIASMELQEKGKKGREEIVRNVANNFEKNKKRVDKNRTDYIFQEKNLVYIERVTILTETNWMRSEVDQSRQ